MYGRPPPTIPSYFPEASKLVAVDSDLRTREEILTLLSANLKQAQLRMTAQAENHRRDVNFNWEIWCMSSFNHIVKFRSVVDYIISFLQDIMALSKFLNALARLHIDWTYLRLPKYIPLSMFLCSSFVMDCKFQIICHCLLKRSAISPLFSLWSLWINVFLKQGRGKY